jgi:hypothetical protein
MRAASFSALLLGLVACGSQPLPSQYGSFQESMDAGAGIDSASPNVFVPSVAASDDPTTCEQAAEWRSYVGCEYWPTVVANDVWSIFDFAVVVANAGTSPASVTITGSGGLSQSQTVAPNGLAKFYLPWVPALKGPDADACGTSAPLPSSVLATGAAYHLVSSVPVTVYQFNALEYAGKGGPAGKDWSNCPGDTTCTDSSSPNYGQEVGCYSFTNDSSLLLPTTALTGNYRVAAYPGETETGGGQSQPIMASYIAITATAPSTHVSVFLAPAADILAGSGVEATTAGGELDLTLDVGDVAELVTDLGVGFDPSGSLIQADQPIQVIAGAPCDQIPGDAPACDHLEQSIFPAETLGQTYFVTLPTGPLGVAVGHDVRLYGNVDGTTLTYAPGAPPGCPATLQAGQVADCGIVEGNFEVSGTHEFAVATFMLGGSIVDPQGGLGDPSQSLVASVEQYRTKYVFLAPNDYDLNFVDIVAPSGTALLLDGAEITATPYVPIADGYGVMRVGLPGTNSGAHTLEASVEIGTQVLGYGLYTSYQYPGGLNLKHIAPPPPPQNTQ